MNPESPLRPVAFVWHAELEDFTTSLAWSPDGKHLAAASVSGEVTIHDSAGHEIHRFKEAHVDGCDALAWRPDGKALASAGRDGTWKLWALADGKKIVEHEAGALWAEHLTWSSRPISDGGHLVALGAGNSVTLWNEKGEPVGESQRFPKTITALAWIMGGATLAVATSTGVSVREPLSGIEESAYFARDPILNMAFSPSGKWLMTGNQDCSVHVWNTDNGGEMHMRGYAAKVRQLAWHRGSRWLAAGGGATISVWDCSGRGPDGRTPLLLEWHPDQVTALHYQPAGDWLASGARDGSIVIWSPTQRQNQISRAKISSGITSVAWSPDGKLLAVTGEGGEVQVLAVE